MGRIDFAVVDHVATITLANAAKRNAVDAAMREQLTDAYSRVEHDDEIRVAVITGEGAGAFSAGGSIDGYIAGNAFGPDGTGPPPVPRPWPIWKPFIAAISGYAVGGGFALALACDLRVAGRGATMGPSGLRRNVVQGAQQSQRLSRLIGASKALELLLLSKYVTGEEAAAMGLVQAVVEDSGVIPTAMDWARTIASFDPWAVSMTKRLVYEGQHLPLAEAFAWEAEVTAASYRRPEALEAFRAFADRSGDTS
ncbi:MAG TPA: enoyl-CoA hydratase/isomerase family protein [Mycobacteriales bacterium]|nr:enoyl-CoA hydratase/isomerase family protein [Mycobacteriales bacterium]